MRVESDPIRIQKGLFLFAMEGGIPNQQQYHFVPYNYGACSFEIYGDLDSLVKLGLVEKKQNVWESWPRYRLTEAGEATVQELSHEADPDALTKLATTKQRLFGQAFFEMLREIYRKY